MSYIVDTNAWLGFFQGNKDYSKSAKRILLDEPWDCQISLASVWEAAIKVGLNKLSLDYDLEKELPVMVADNGFALLELDFSDVVAVKELPPIHGDPFDRIQAAQARRRGWKIISRDPVFDHYGLERLW